jgi:hypothetical protein
MPSIAQPAKRSHGKRERFIFASARGHEASTKTLAEGDLAAATAELRARYPGFSVTPPLARDLARLRRK